MIYDGWMTSERLSPGQRLSGLLLIVAMGCVSTGCFEPPSACEATSDCFVGERCQAGSCVIAREEGPDLSSGAADMRDAGADLADSSSLVDMGGGTQSCEERCALEGRQCQVETQTCEPSEVVVCASDEECPDGYACQEERCVERQTLPGALATFAATSGGEILSWMAWVPSSGASSERRYVYTTNAFGVFPREEARLDVLFSAQLLNDQILNCNMEFYVCSSLEMPTELDAVELACQAAAQDYTSRQEVDKVGVSLLDTEIFGAISVRFQSEMKPDEPFLGALFVIQSCTDNPTAEPLGESSLSDMRLELEVTGVSGEQVQSSYALYF